jgi:Uma2 family endonuclease
VSMPIRTPDEVHYPDSDGKPIGETPRHVCNMFYSLFPLQKWFENDDRVFVAANMFVYYVQGDATKRVSPDLFVAKGVPRERKPEWRKYLVWQEGKAPDLITEFTSESTRHEDLVEKKALYQDVLKVQEYFLFDPWDECLVPRLQGWRLVNGLYQPIEPVAGRLPSRVLGLHVEGKSELLRFFDPKTSQYLLIPLELDELRQQAEMARQQAETATRQIRREIEELRKRLPPNGNPA